ncbi:hypothetical protein BGZ59_003810 [Podila verticillata]|nr:hypothetical protein BGZ59_003810 [Podila verticillata]
MGTTGLFQRLKALLLDVATYQLTDMSGYYIDIDLLGTFYQFLRSLLIQFDGPDAGYKAGRYLGFWLRNSLHVGQPGGNQVCIHLDGAPCVEKAKASAKRTATYNRHLHRVDQGLAKMERQSIAGKWTPQTTMTTIVKGLTNLYVISDDVKEGIRHGIEASGLQFCQCHTEADLCIARCSSIPLATSLTRAVMSADSDLLIYSAIQVVIRPMPKSRDFGIYSKDAILQTLHLDSPEHLVLLGTISDNDYVQNIRSLGLVRNVEIVKSIVPAHSHTMLMSYIQKARAKVTQDIKNDHFKFSESVFMNLMETVLSVDPATNNVFIGRCAQFLALKDLRAEQAAALARHRVRPPFYVAPGSHKNQYRPIFSSKETILCGSLYEDISTAKERDQAFANKLASQPRPPKPKKTMKKRKKVARTPSAPSQVTRNWRIATIIDRELRKKHPTKIRNLGCISGAMRAQQQFSDAEVLDTKNHLQSIVFLMNTLQLRLYYAYAITIDALLATAPPPVGSSARPAWAPTTDQERKSILDRLLTVDFARDLARALFNGIKDDPQEEDFELPQGPLDLAHLSYFLFARATSLLPLRLKYSGLQISELSKMAASPVITAVKTHYQNAVFADESDEPQDPTLSAIESFFLRNEARRSFADFPKARFVPGFVYLTEEGLVHALWATETTKVLLQTILRRVGEEDLYFRKDMASLHPVLEGSAPEEPTALEQASLVHSLVIQPRADGSLDLGPVLETFSTKGRAVDYVQEHKGRLIDALFGRGNHPISLQQELDEKRLRLKGTITCNGLEVKALVYDTQYYRPKAARELRAQGIMAQTEHEFLREVPLDIQDNGAEEDDDDDQEGLEGLDDDDEIDAAFLELDESEQETTGPGGSGGQDQTDPDIGLPGWVDVGMDMMDVDRDGIVAAGGFVGPGDLIQQRLPYDQVLIRDPFMGVMTPQVDEDIVLDESALDIHRRRSSSTPAQQNRLIMNFKQASKLVPNIEVHFDHPEKCPDPDNAILLGMDPGEVNSLTITKLDPRFPNQRHVLKVRRSFLSQPDVRFRNALQDRKAAEGINQLESQIPEFSRATLERHFFYLTSCHHLPGTVQGTWTVWDRILNFYQGSSWYLKKKWEVSKARTACLDYAIKAILRLAGGSEGRKHRTDDRPVVMCLGLGSFNSQSGLPSKHSVLERRLVIKARTLGYTIVGVNEFWTSAKCPRPQCNSFLRNVGRARSKYCGSCRMHFDRDAVGSENIAWIGDSQIRHQCRPPKFKPPDRL